MKRGGSVLAACAAVLLLLAPLGLAALAPRGQAEPGRHRILGPVAPILAQAQWLRFDREVWRGDVDRALGLARSALELDPRSTPGWIRITWHLAFDRGSAERNLTSQERLGWLRAGLACAREGEARAREPADLAQLQAALAWQLAQEDPPIDWPGGREALLQESWNALARAERLRDSN